MKWTQTYSLKVVCISRPILCGFGRKNVCTNHINLGSSHTNKSAIIIIAQTYKVGPGGPYKVINSIFIALYGIITGSLSSVQHVFVREVLYKYRYKKLDVCYICICLMKNMIKKLITVVVTLLYPKDDTSFQVQIFILNSIYHE